MFVSVVICLTRRPQRSSRRPVSKQSRTLICTILSKKIESQFDASLMPTRMGGDIIPYSTEIMVEKKSDLHESCSGEASGTRQCKMRTRVAKKPSKEGDGVNFDLASEDTHVGLDIRHRAATLRGHRAVVSLGFSPCSLERFRARTVVNLLNVCITKAEGRTFRVPRSRLVGDSPANWRSVGGCPPYDILVLRAWYTAS